MGYVLIFIMDYERPGNLFFPMLGYHYLKSLNKTRPKGVNPPGVRMVEIPCKRRGFLFLGMEK